VSRTDVAGSNHFSTDERKVLFAVFIRASFTLVAISASTCGIRVDVPAHPGVSVLRARC
jgi:hypothetical protein